MPRPLVAVTPAAGFVQGPLLAPEVDIGRWPTASHIGNAILREDARGARLAKERKDSPRRIDAAVAAVMAVHRAADLAMEAPLSIYFSWASTPPRAAALAGVVRDSIYI